MRVVAGRAVVSWRCPPQSRQQSTWVIKCEGCGEQTAINLPNTSHHHSLQRTEGRGCVCLYCCVRMGATARAGERCIELCVCLLLPFDEWTGLCVCVCLQICECTARVCRGREHFACVNRWVSTAVLWACLKPWPQPGQQSFVCALRLIHICLSIHRHLFWFAGDSGHVSHSVSLSSMISVHIIPIWR